jgi:hypothetical protein
MTKSHYLKLTLSDKTYKRLKSQMAMKYMVDNIYGLKDEIMLRILKAIEKEEEGVIIFLKEERMG